MSPLRMPQHLADPSHTDTGEAVMKFELLEELEQLHHAEARVEVALRVLREHDAAGGGSPSDRRALVDAASEAVWRLIVQHEACDCCDHTPLIERYNIPVEVMSRLGAAH